MDELGQLSPPIIRQQETPVEELARVYTQLKADITSHVLAAEKEGKKPYVLIGVDHKSNRSLQIGIMTAEIVAGLKREGHNIGMYMPEAPHSYVKTWANDSRYIDHVKAVGEIIGGLGIPTIGMDIEMPKNIEKAYVAAYNGDKTALAEFNKWKNDTMGEREAHMVKTAERFPGGLIICGIFHAKGIVEGLTEKGNCSVFGLNATSETTFKTENPVQIERAKFAENPENMKPVKLSQQAENIPLEQTMQILEEAIMLAQKNVNSKAQEAPSR